MQIKRLAEPENLAIQYLFTLSFSNQLQLDICNRGSFLSIKKKKYKTK